MQPDGALWSVLTEVNDDALGVRGDEERVGQAGLCEAMPDCDLWNCFTGSGSQAGFYSRHRRMACSARMTSVSFFVKSFLNQA